MSSSEASPPALVGLHYRVPRLRAGWELSEEPMPESVVHDQAVELLKAILAAWAARTGKTFVGRNLAIRWDRDHPRIGVDPDVCVLSPAPSSVLEVRSIRTWEAEHVPPLLAIEVVSETNPHKDYAIAPEKYAASGTRELWIFDPLLSGPTTHGGPFTLQIWHRRSDGDFVRVHAGEGPARSPTLEAWLVTKEDGRKLRIAEDREAAQLWLSAEEAERAGKEAALARVAELEAALARANAKAKEPG